MFTSIAARISTMAKQHRAERQDAAHRSLRICRDAVGGSRLRGDAFGPVGQDPARCRL